MQSNNKLACALAVVLATGSTTLTFAQDSGNQQLEEVVVTGSYIRGTPEDAPSPVQVINRDEMIQSGSPTIVELVRNLGPSSGVDGETNQFQSNGLEGIANINLRGLGPARTLVLLNGKRQVFSPYGVAENGQLFVNINAIPSLALERLEVLKDGAAATYGSDAIAGVVNFITRSNFEGFEISADYKGIQDSDGDWQIGAIAGVGNESTNWVTSVGFFRRSELSSRERDFSLTTYEENPNGGFSAIGNPGTLLPINAAGVPVGGLTPDPDCETVGSVNRGGFCRFRFTPFDNLVEKENHLQVFSELNHDFSDTLAFHAEFLYSNDEVPEWKTSPSYPPQVFVDPNQIVRPGHPGFDDWLQRHPELASTFAEGAIFVGRPFGVGGPVEVGNREYDTYRFASSLTGTFDNGMGFDLGLSWSKSTGERNTNDTYRDRLRLGYLGLGGPNCDPVNGTPGQGGCEYYNPFVSNFEQTAVSAFGETGIPNPAFNPALQNSQELRDWLTDFVGSEVTTELLVLDAVINGDWFEMQGGAAQWAAGVQFRQEDYDFQPNDVANLEINPCPAPGDTTCASPTGPFGFLAGALPFQTDQDIYAIFGELRLPVMDNLDVQLALRFEDYGGEVGDTIDPKIAARWDVNEWVTLRGSASTTFRGPGLNQLGGQFTSLQFVGATGAFKAIDTSGNPNLEPESATTFNIGIILQPVEGLFASLDYWSFDFDDAIIIEPFDSIVAAFQDPATSAAAATRLSPAGLTSAAQIERIEVQYRNGPNIKTSGIDVAINYDITMDSGILSVGTDFTWVSEYDVESFEILPGVVSPAFEAVGFLNSSQFTRPIPEFKARFFANYAMGPHNFRADINHTASYDDERYLTTPFAGTLDPNVDSHTTLDLHYNFIFNEDRTRVSASIFNITDEDPPFAARDLSYDPFTHNALGIMWKLGVVHRFDFF